MNVLGVLVAVNHPHDAIMVHHRKQVDLALQVIEPPDLGLVYRLARECEAGSAAHALADLPVVALAEHPREDYVIVRHVGEASGDGTCFARAAARVATGGSGSGKRHLLVQCAMLDGRVIVLDGVVDAFAVRDGADDATTSAGGCGASSAHDWFGSRFVEEFGAWWWDAFGGIFFYELSSDGTGTCGVHSGMPVDSRKRPSIFFLSPQCDRFDFR